MLDFQLPEKFEHYYTYKNRNGEEVVTVCLLRDEFKKDTIVHEGMARGISICSIFDKENIKKGRQEAKNHAIAAIKKRHLKTYKDFFSVNLGISGSNLISDPRALLVLIETKCPFNQHRYLNPELLPFEVVMIVGRGKIRKAFITSAKKGNYKLPKPKKTKIAKHI